MLSFHQTPLKRVNSIGLVFNKENPSQEFTRIILFDNIGVKLEDINVVQFLRDRVIVKFFEDEVYKKFVDLFEGKIWRFGNLMVQCTDESSSITYVSIRDCPPEMESSVIANILNQYGTVEALRFNRYKYGPFEGALNGIRTAKMRVKRNIPSKITVNGYQIHLLYNGQKRTCFKCGLEDHEARECITEYSDRRNIFSTNDFPSLNNVTENREVELDESRKDENKKESEDKSEDKLPDAPDNECSEEGINEGIEMNSEVQNTGNLIVLEAEIHSDIDGNNEYSKEVQMIETAKRKSKKSSRKKEVDEELHEASATPPMGGESSHGLSHNDPGQGGKEDNNLDLQKKEICGSENGTQAKETEQTGSFWDNDLDLWKVAKEWDCEMDLDEKDLKNNEGKDSTKRQKHDCYVTVMMRLEIG